MYHIKFNSLSMFKLCNSNGWKLFMQFTNFKFSVEMLKIECQLELNKELNVTLTGYNDSAIT